MVEKMYKKLEETFGHDVDAFPYYESDEIKASIEGLKPENLEVALSNFDEFVDGCRTVYDFFKVLGTKGMLKSTPAIVNGHLRLRYNRYLGDGTGSYCQVSATPTGIGSCSKQMWGNSYFYPMLKSQLSVYTRMSWDKYFAFMASAQCASQYREYRELFWSRSHLICELAKTDSSIFNLFSIGADKKDTESFAIYGTSSRHPDGNCVYAILHVGEKHVSIETDGYGCFTIYFPDSADDEIAKIDGTFSADSAFGLSDEFISYLKYMCGRTLLSVCGYNLEVVDSDPFYVDRYSKLSPIYNVSDDVKRVKTSGDFYNICFGK